MQQVRVLAAAAVLAAGLGYGLNASAAPIDVYPLAIDPNSVACTSLGDFVSCSAPYLNLLAGLPQGQSTTSDPVGYILPAGQGQLDNTLVIGTGSGNPYSPQAGGAPDNSDLGITDVDQAYPTLQAQGGQNVNYSTINAANGDPPPTFTGDTSKAWDIHLDSLIQALTINQVRHNMVIAFDHNQEGTDADQSIKVWALVVLRDLDGPNLDKVFELNPSNVGPFAFNSTKTFADYIDDQGPLNSPQASEFVTSAAIICVDPNTLLPTGTVPPGSACDPGDIPINNNLGSNEAEFINFIPELDANLELYKQQGYDMISVRFDVAANSNGFEDIFVVAGPVTTTQVPEPSTLLSMGAGLLLLGLASRRRRPRS